MARVVLALVALFAAIAVVSCDTPEHLKWADLDPYKGQWNVTFALTSTSDKSVFIPHNCSQKNLGKACNQPPMSPDDNDKIKINITLKNATTVANFKTHNAGKPKKVVIKLCYSETSSMDRPWRKANKVIKKDKSCPIKVKAFPWVEGGFQNHTAVFNFTSKKDLTKAVWYVRVITFCDDGTTDGVQCQYDGTKAKNYFETKTIDQITSSLTITLIVLSIAGPAFMIGFFVVDTIRRKNK